MDPMLHLVRNAVSHGIETPWTERIAAGKPPDGTIRLSATRGWRVGRHRDRRRRRGGIDARAVARARAERRHAGRGRHGGCRDAARPDLCVGLLDARRSRSRQRPRRRDGGRARDTVEELAARSTLETDARPGHAFHHRAAADAGDHRRDHRARRRPDVRRAAVRSARSDRGRGGDRSPLEQNEIDPYRGRALPIVRLARLFGIATAARGRGCTPFVVGTGLRAVGLAVDRIVGQREIVVRSIADPLIHVDGVSGATDLGDGRLVLILDVARAMSRGARERPRAAEGAAA